MEVLPPAGDRADLRLLAVAEQHDSVVMEEVGNCIAIVGEVLLKGSLEVAMDVLAFDEQQGQAVDEADDVGSPAVEVAPHPQLAHAEEIIVLRRLEVEDPQPLPRALALVVAEGNLHAIAHQRVLLAVGGDDALRSTDGGHLSNRVVIGVCGQARIQRHQLGAQRALQHHFAVRGADEQTVRPEVLVVGVDRRPAEPLFEIIGGGLLNEGRFAEV